MKLNTFFTFLFETETNNYTFMLYDSSLQTKICVLIGFKVQFLIQESSYFPMLSTLDMIIPFSDCV